ncbi:class I SAM-dependent methyltransferase [Brevundimonas sp.]|uniref:class I SAM-dependent methyltransferase n=1 Tax=Brevundimonas sp. TaxID=1871086 RepID=UPI0028AE89FC|nr:class I SAM-dependent methyltransferase [Brevundimonas sp.]
MIYSFREYDDWLARAPNFLRSAVSISDALYVGEPSSGWLAEGWCNVCDRRSAFWTDYLHTNRAAPNWRERQVCKDCGFNSRTRLTLEVVKAALPQRTHVYATEFVTPVFRWLSERFDVIGSEFDASVPSGGNLGQVPIQDVTALSFASAAFDAVCSFDVLEHVPNYRSALREFARVLRPGGKLILTAPFLLESETNVLRAQQVEGEVVHHHPPEMHGDPMNPQGGILAYHTFGWALLHDLRLAGFEASAMTTWAPGFGYLGQPGPVIVAVKN